MFTEERVAPGTPLAQPRDACGGRVQQCGTPVAGVGLPSQQPLRDQVVDQGADGVGREAEVVRGGGDPDARSGGDKTEQFGVRPTQPGWGQPAPQPSPGEPLDAGQKSGELIR